MGVFLIYGAPGRTTAHFSVSDRYYTHPWVPPYGPDLRLFKFYPIKFVVLPLVMKNCSRQFFIPGILPYTLWVALRAFKFAPDKFVEPCDEQFRPEQQT